MCKVFEDMKNENSMQIAIKLCLNEKMLPEKAAEICNIPVEKLNSELKRENA